MCSEGVSVFPGRRSANGRHRRVQGAGQRSGQQAAGSGAVATMAGEPKLAGARCLPDSEHRFLKEKHRELENHFANSPKRSNRAEGVQRGRGARGGGVAFGKMQSFALRRLGFLGRASNGKRNPLRCLEAL